MNTRPRFRNRGFCSSPGPSRSVLLMVMGSLLILPLLLSACGGSSSYAGMPGYYTDDPLTAAMRELDDFLVPIQVIMAIAGLAMMLAGYKIYRYVIMIPGIILGGVLGMVIGADENTFLAIVGLLLGALIGAGLALLIHDLLIILIGASIGVAMVAGITLANNNMPEAWAIILGAIVGGIGLLALSRAAIIFYTSAVGSLLFGLGIQTTGLWLLLFFAVGVGVQYGLARALGDSIGSGAAASGAAGAGFALKRKPGTITPPEKDPLERLPMMPMLTPGACLIENDENGCDYLHDKFLIGRGSDCDIQFTARNVSRRHALLRQSGEDWFIQDQDSAGGTFVNGERVQARRLSPGDQITIGDHTLRFLNDGN
ncbi:MAG: DUF4203 domain-containing protein [Anaerolineales bacterium]|nr:DUF4203 domain-containing protein [Anaerolineales bacterium]